MALEATTPPSSQHPLYFSPQSEPLPKLLLVVGAILLSLGLLVAAGVLIPSLTSYSLPMQISGIVLILVGMSLMIAGYQLKNKAIDLSQFFINDKWQGESYLHRFIEQENIELIKLALKNGYNVNVKGSHGSTPLHKVVGTWFFTPGQQLNAVKLLIDNGAGINETDDYGETPLHEAHTLACVKLLIKHGADIDKKNKQGATPLHKFILCIVDDKKVPLMAKFILQQGASVDEIDKKGNTPLLVVCKQILNSVITSHRSDTILCLLEAGADVSIVDSNGNTAFEILRNHSAIPPQFLELLNPKLTKSERTKAIKAYKASPKQGNFRNPLLFSAFQ